MFQFELFLNHRIHRTHGRKISFQCIPWFLLLIALSSMAEPVKRPNVVILFADDISAREIPVYGSTVWADEKGRTCSDPKLRAETPVLDRLAAEGCYIKNAWSATSCMPSRAMLMTGRYAHLQKWWENGDLGTVETHNGKRTWLIFESSPILIGYVARWGGYASCWAGKTQMLVNPDQIQGFGFDEGVLTPGDESNPNDMPNSFKLDPKIVDGKVVMSEHGWPAVFNCDTGNDAKDGYPMRSTAFKPHITVMNEHGVKTGIEWKKTELNDYGADIELDYCLEFMERQHKKGKPFFVYHTTHLGHDAFDWLLPDSGNKWPGTPVVKWDGEKYERTPVNITGEKGEYNTHGTVSEPGIHSHIKYIDYIIWRYLEKMKQLGIENDTIFIFCADNGTSGYGKHQVDKQKGTHIPMIIYAPGSGMVRTGEQDILVSLADILPTLAEMMQVKLPFNYEIDGTSFWAYLTGAKDLHHDWIYSYKNGYQMIRGFKVLRDGHGKWWDVEKDQPDLNSYPLIEDWEMVSGEHKKERDLLKGILPRLDKHKTEHDAPSE